MPDPASDGALCGVQQAVTIFELVKRDLDDRDKLGRETYGGDLTAQDGRDFLVEAYQEALDLAVYLRGAIEQRRSA
jgi:hypothetical protein